MHMIGRDVKSWAVLPGGKTKELLHIPDWDFNWQDTYRYKKPFVLPKGTVVHTTWTWNNTSEHPRNPNSPPKRIVWGEGSADEMTGLIMSGIVVKPQDEGTMWIAIIAHYFEVERAANDAKKSGSNNRIRMRINSRDCQGLHGHAENSWLLNDRLFSLVPRQDFVRMSYR